MCESVHKVEDAVAELAARIKAVEPDPERTAIVRLAVDIDDLDPIAWLSSQKSQTKVYWRDRNGAFEIAGVGTADLVLTDELPVICDPLFDRIRRHMIADNDISLPPRYYGGLQFDQDGRQRKDAGFGKLGTCWFVLPRFEILREREATKLICNIVTNPEEKGKLIGRVARETEFLVFDDTPARNSMPEPTDRTDSPDFEDWRQNIETAGDLFESGHLEKIVLARKSVFKFKEAPDPYILLSELRDSGQDCFVFCFQTSKESAFLGASPERLYRKDGRSIECEAVAGTRPRGVSEAEDSRLGDELLHSDKDAREHSFVTKWFESSLPGLTESFKVTDKLTLRKLSNVQHLTAEVNGTLKEGVGDADILGALHPTPAVGGHPKDDALAHIATLEPFARGWYAGPVGWIEPDRTEFAVAIRSGLIDNLSISLFSGAGIVSGSDPEAEWNEIESKIGNYLNILSGK